MTLKKISSSKPLRLEGCDYRSKMSTGCLSSTLQSESILAGLNSHLDLRV